MNRSAVEQIKERIPIEDLIGQYVKLEKSGKSFKARCPFHNEKSASFFVSPERGGYYCFGCNAKGDIFTFVEQFEGLDFKGALKILAERAGVKLVNDKKTDSERDLLFAVMEDAASYFEQQFALSKYAQEYLTKRGITEKTREEFRIGWVPEGWSNLHSYLKKKGYTDALMEKAGLVKRKEQGARSMEEGVGSIRESEHVHFPGTPSTRARVAAPSHSPSLAPKVPPNPHVPIPDSSSTSSASSVLLTPSSSIYDRFRGRIMFPISDSSGRIVAFSGRILKEDPNSAKYLNSPDTPLYDKSLILYGLHKAKSEIRRMNYTIMVEGQMDLVMSHQAGIRNTVAASGTALTDETFNQAGVVSNLGLVRRLSQNVLIAFDSDLAGRKAALRAAGIALSLGMDVKIVDITGGKDPADLVKENVEIWKNALRAAKPIIEFELDNVLKEVTDPRKVPKALQERVFPLLARIESQSDQSFFVVMIADRTQVPIDAIWQDLKIVTQRLKAAAQAAQPNTPATGQKQDANPSQRTSDEMPKRIDIVERRLFGLLHILEKENADAVATYRTQIKTILGENYETYMAKMQPLLSDMSYEAEAFFGTDMQRAHIHIRELLFNFEEDMISQELIDAMQALKLAEKAGDATRASELVQKCHLLSQRKVEISKKRKG